MLRIPLLAVALCASSFAFGQLSKGEGHSIQFSGKKYSCHLPKHFEIQEQPPGVIHKASGAFIIAVKVPEEKKLAADGSIPRSFFEDPRYEIVSLREEKPLTRQASAHRTYWMLYKLQGFEFERFTTLVSRGNEQYLIIANFPVKLKNQVEEEVKKVMETFIIR